MKRPQPALPMLLADGFSAVYPCHVPAREMRTHPIGTGPFKFVKYPLNSSQNAVPTYWQNGCQPFRGGGFTAYGVHCSYNDRGTDQQWKVAKACSL